MASLRMLFSEDTLEEVGYSLRRLNPTFAGARPWKEFFACFKPPEHLEKRMSTNLLHYKANYCIIFVLVVALGLLSSPRAIFALGICAALAAACLLAEVRGRYIQVGSFKVPVTKSSRASAAAICSVVTLVVSGQALVRCGNAVLGVRREFALPRRASRKGREMRTISTTRVEEAAAGPLDRHHLLHGAPAAAAAHGAAAAHPRGEVYERAGGRARAVVRPADVGREG